MEQTTLTTLDDVTQLPNLPNCRNVRLILAKCKDFNDSVKRCLEPAKNLRELCCFRMPDCITSVQSRYTFDELDRLEVSLSDLCAFKAKIIKSLVILDDVQDSNKALLYFLQNTVVHELQVRKSLIKREPMTFPQNNIKIDTIVVKKMEFASDDINRYREFFTDVQVKHLVMIHDYDIDTSLEFVELLEIYSNRLSKLCLVAPNLKALRINSPNVVNILVKLPKLIYLGMPTPYNFNFTMSPKIRFLFFYKRSREQKRVAREEYKKEITEAESFVDVTKEFIYNTQTSYEYVDEMMTRLNDLLRVFNTHYNTTFKNTSDKLLFETTLSQTKDQILKELNFVM